jgi:phage terminase Nu1 subunit (DNA packaging protein)
MNLAELTQTEAAALLGIAPRTLRDWADAPRNSSGRYNWISLLGYRDAKLYGDREFDDQRERLAAAQAEKVETENAVRRGELAVMSEVQRVWSDHIAAARAKLLGIPAKLAPQVTGIHEPNVIAAAIRAEITAALAELAEYEPAETGPEQADGVESVEAAPDADSQPVGRRGKKAQ